MWQALIVAAVWLGASLLTFSETVWQQAPLENAAVKRLPPSAFPQLPGAVRSHLQARRCLIPQTELEPAPHNVISGAFARPGQRDWAVLCSRNGFSSILVFWNGHVDSVAELAHFPDNTFLQGAASGKTEYSRGINAVSKDYILSHYQGYKESGAPKPPPLRHQGIDDAFLGKASTVHYYYRGKWRQLQGAD